MAWKGHAIWAQQSVKEEVSGSNCCAEKRRSGIGGSQADLVVGKLRGVIDHRLYIWGESSRGQRGEAPEKDFEGQHDGGNEQGRKGNHF